MVGSETEATVMLNVVPGLNTGITAFNAGLSSINAQFQNVTDTVYNTFGVLDAMVLSSGAVLAQFGLGAASAFGEFEQGMKIVQAVSQQSGEAIGYLKQQAQEFSIQYRTDIDSITEGLQTLGRAGLNSASEQTEVLENGLQTAKLEGRELNGVLEEIIQNTALLGGDINSDTFGEQSGYLNDLLVGTSLSAPLDTHDISETLKYSGGMLAAAGGTIATEEGGVNEAGRELVEDYMGAVALFAQKGVKGSIAGTALRAFFNKPATQDKSVVDALSEIGMAPEDLWNDEETMKPVSEQIGLIQRQMEAKNISKMDQMQIWSKIVGGKMGQQMMKLDSQDIKEMTSEIQQASSAETLANQTFDTYNQKVTQLHEQTQKLFRDFGQHIIVALKPAVEIVSKIVDLLNNPMLQGVSFVAFIGFVATLSHALQAALRVLQRLRAELSGLFFGGLNFDPQALLNVGHKGIPKKPYLRIAKPSDMGEIPPLSSYLKKEKSDKSSSATKSVEKQKQIDDYFNKKQQGYNNVSKQIKSIENQTQTALNDISSQVNGFLNTLTEKINSLDMSIDINVDELQGDIQGLQSEIRGLIDAVSVVATETEKKSRAVTESIKEQIREIKAMMMQGPGTGQPIGDWDGAVNEETLKGRFKKAEMQAMLDEAGIKYRKNDNKSVLAKLMMENGLASNFGDEFLPYQMINGNMAAIESDIIKTIQNDPYFKDKKTPSGLGYIDNDDVNSLGMFGPHLVALPPNIVGAENLGEDILRYIPSHMVLGLSQLLNDPLATQYPGIFTGESDLDNIHNARVGILQDNKDADEAEVKILQGLFNTVEDIHNNMVIEDHDVNEAYYNKHTSMRDLDEQYKQAQKEFRDEFGKSKMWSDIHSVTDKNLSSKTGLAALFDDVYNQDEMDKFWGGMSEEEFNKQYRRQYADAWDIDQHRIDWARNNADDLIGSGLYTTEKDIARSQQFLDAYEQAEGDLIAKRDSMGNFLGYGKKEDVEFTSHHEQGLLSLFGEAEVPENHSRSYAKQASLSEKLRHRLEKGTEKASAGLDNFAKKLGSESTGKLGKVVDMLGGPFSVALMGATAAMELYNYMFGQWQKSVQEHQQKISEAENKVSEAEDNIRKAYQKANPNATQAEINKAVDEAYVSIADNNYKMSGLDENTQALYVATSQLQRANALLEQDATDNKFGRTGLFTTTADTWEQLMNQLPLVGNWGTQVVQDTGEMGDAFGKLGFGYNTQAGSILDNQGNAVLTGSQSSSDYFYSKENAAIFADDVFKAHQNRKQDAVDGLYNFFGTDAKHFQEVTKGIFKGEGDYGGSAYDTMVKMIASNFGDSGEQHKLQMALKNYQKDFQVVGKQMRKFEKANKGRTALSEFGKKGVSSAKALKNLEVKDKDLYRYIKSLSIKTGLSEQKILMAAQLQQMQDLNQIMVDQLQPQVMGIATNAYQQLSASLSTNQKTGSAASGANSTAVSAAAIAAKLSVLVEEALDKEMQSDYISRGGTDDAIINDPSGQVLKSKVVAAWNKDASSRTPWEDFLVSHYGKNYLQSEYLSGWDLAHPDATEAQRKAAMDNYWKNVSQYDTYQGAINATRTGANTYYTGALLDAYDASSIGEQEGTPSGASGGSGSGDKDKDKDKGTKKERVDLVLCNKKEIPKLNVNLFKKAPQFTILNKNFKLRDIKINTQDKPKAVLDSIKNAIIDTQRRMDPKIIQDENAEYDPVAATDGNPTPSGSTSTTTD